MQLIWRSHKVIIFGLIICLTGFASYALANSEKPTATKKPATKIAVTTTKTSKATTAATAKTKVAVSQVATDTKAKAKLPGFAYTKPEAKAEAVAAARDLKAIVASGKIIVALPSDDQALFFSTEKNGELVGYSIDIANDIGKELGVKVEFNRDAKTFDDLVDLLAQGQADLSVANLSKTTERAKKVLYTDPYLVLNRSLLIDRAWLADNKKALKMDNTIAILNKQSARIGTLGKSAYVYFAQKIFPNVKLTIYPSIEDAFAALESGALNAVFADNLQIAEELEAKPRFKLTFQEIVLDDRPDILAFATAPQAWNLWQWLNQYLMVQHEKITPKGLLQYQ